MLLWMAIAAAARPLYIQPADDGSFRVVDHRGDNVGAWHFAHFTRDRKKVGQLRFRLYFRRTSAIACLAGGALAFGIGTASIFERRRAVGYDGSIDPGMGALGVITAGALAALVVHPTNVLMRRPDWLRVDTHYTQEEALERIQKRGRVQIWASPVGVYARF